MKCITLYSDTNIIITENMDVYEVYREGELSFDGIPTEDYKGNYFVRQLPLKAEIDFKKYYGDDGKANWCCDYLPWIKEDNKLIWNY